MRRETVRAEKEGVFQGRRRGREGHPPSARRQAEHDQLYTRTLVEAVEGLASWLSRPKRVAMLLMTFILRCRGGLCAGCGKRRGGGART